MSHIQLINHSTHLFPAFITQWFSSGKITRRLGTPSLHRHLISTIHLPLEKRNALLQCMEHSDSISLGEPVVLAPMDRQLWGRPLGHSVRRAVFPRCFECGGLPWASSPFVVELQCVESVVVNILVLERKDARRRARRWRSRCKLCRRPVTMRIDQYLPIIIWLGKRTPSWQTSALKPNPSSGFPWIQL
jgi:hypothetical protein